MNNKKIIKNYTYNLAYQIINMLIPLVTTPYVSRVLGADNIGIYSYTNSIATYFVLFTSAGINIYGQREIAYVQQKPERRTQIFKEVMVIRIVFTGVLSLVYWALFWNSSQFMIIYRILFINVAANAFDISWFFQGLEDFKKTALRNIMIRIVGVIGIFAFVKNENDLIPYVLCYALPTLIGNFSLWPYLSAYLVKAKLNIGKCKRHIIPIAVLFIPQVAIEVYTVLDKTMLGKLASGMDEVGFYEQSQKLVKIGVKVLTAFGAVMMSRVANAYKVEGDEAVKKNLFTSFHFNFLIGFPLMFGLMGVAGSVVPWFFGPGYESVTFLIIITAPIVIAIGCSNAIGTQYLIPTNQQGIYTISVIGGAISNIILNTILIPKFSAIGASVASVIAEWTVTCIQGIAVRKKIPIKSYLKMVWKYLLSAIVMLIAIIAIRQFIEYDFICTVTQIVIGITVYFMILLFLKEKIVVKLFKAFWRVKRPGGT